MIRHHEYAVAAGSQGVVDPLGALVFPEGECGSVLPIPVDCRDYPGPGNQPVIALPIGYHVNDVMGLPANVIEHIRNIKLPLSVPIVLRTRLLQGPELYRQVVAGQ